MDDPEVWFDKRVTDGLPVVPPMRECVERHLFETVRVPYRTLLPDAENGEGTTLRFTKGREQGPEEFIPKFPSVEEIHVVVAGGTAGRFPMAVAGWFGTKNGSTPMTVPVGKTVGNIP